MGVPGLSSWIGRYFKNIKYEVQKNLTSKVNYLYIDANGLLHSAAQEIYKYLEKDSPIIPVTKENNILVYKKFIELVNEIISIVNPINLVYLSLDGPAPEAKQAQQRQRRFLSAKYRKNDNIFDSNAITPGTDFMNDLDKYIINDIENSYNELQTTVGIYYSSIESPGEGEHKILNYIRDKSLIDETFAISNHCIYGVDGDLVMLGLACNLPNILLLRDYMKKYEVIDIGSLRVLLNRYLYFSRISGNKPIRIQRPYCDAISDFILAGFFIGNDFLPRISMFDTLQGGFELMIDSIKELSKNNMFITESNKITKNFKSFVTLLASFEIDHLENQIDNALSLDKSSKFRFNTLLNNIQTNKIETPNINTLNSNFEEVFSTPTVSVKKYSLNFEDFRKDYYNKVFKNYFGSMISINIEEEINNMCNQYLKMISWVFQYYINGVPSWKEKYTYNYPPLIIDLSKYMLSLNDKNYNSLMNYDFKTEYIQDSNQMIIQLLSVLPSRSNYLIPKNYRTLHLEITKNIDFKIDYEGKLKEHMGVSLLPFIDTNSLKELIKSI